MIEASSVILRIYATTFSFLKVVNSTTHVCNVSDELESFDGQDSGMRESFNRGASTRIIYDNQQLESCQC